MFFTSTLLPAGNPCKNDCSGNWFGWTSPISSPGQILLGNIGNGAVLPGVLVGAVGTPSSGANPYNGVKFSFSGGTYQNEFISALLTPGKWRVFALWTTGKNIETDVSHGKATFDVALATSLLVKNSLSLVNDSEGAGRPITLLGSGQFGTPQNPPFFGASFGGVDGCNRFYFSEEGKVRALGCDVVIGPHERLYLKAESKNADQVVDMITAAFGPPNPNIPYLWSTAYQVAAFYMEGCRCGGFLESSVAAGF